jgi:transmembrane sensor
MNSTDHLSDPQTEETAALWAARLDGSTLKESERAELEQWLEAKPSHRTLLSAYCQFSTDLEVKLPVLLATGGIELPSPVPAKSQRRWGIRLAVLGSMAAAAVAFLAWINLPRTQFTNVATPVAERQSLALIDGSTIDLDARTSLRVEIDATTRRVQLADGQAYFAITKDPARPFVVETPIGSIRVKGTKFDVQTDRHKELTVAVLEGVVQVSPMLSGNAIEPVLLEVGDQLTLGPTGVLIQKLSPSQLEDRIAWRQGQVVFDGTPLNEALERFSRHHGIGITATGNAAGQRIGGRYSLDDLDGFFTALEDALPVKVSRSLNGTIQVGLRESSTIIRARE